VREHRQNRTGDENFIDLQELNFSVMPLPRSHYLTIIRRFPSSESTSDIIFNQRDLGARTVNLIRLSFRISRRRRRRGTVNWVPITSCVNGKDDKPVKDKLLAIRDLDHDYCKI
jgi:hypothetical protein